MTRTQNRVERKIFSVKNASFFAVRRCLSFICGFGFLSFKHSNSFPDGKWNQREKFTFVAPLKFFLFHKFSYLTKVSHESEDYITKSLLSSTQTNNFFSLIEIFTRIRASENFSAPMKSAECWKRVYFFTRRDSCSRAPSMKRGEICFQHLAVFIRVRKCARVANIP